MKDFVTVNINTDHNYECGTEILARAGEGSTTSLDIIIPEALLNYDAYLDFEKPNGESIRTPRLEVVDGVAHYDIAPYILTEHGNLKVQVVLQGSNGEIWKSSIKQYAIQKSINAVDDIPDKEDFISEAQKLVDELNKDVSEIAEMLSNDADFVDTVIDGMKFATWINTIDGSKLRFFVGTKAEYEALTDTENLFAIITDDATKDELFDAIVENTNAIKTNANAIKANTDDIEENATQIATNKNNITSLTSRVTAVESKATTNATNIAKNTSDISDLTSKVATHTSQISDLQTAASGGTGNYTRIYEADLSQGGNIWLVGTTAADALTNNAVYLVVFSTSAAVVTGVLGFNTSHTYASTSLGSMTLSITGSGTTAAVYTADLSKVASGKLSFYQIGTINSIY